MLGIVGHVQYAHGETQSPRVIPSLPCPDLTVQLSWFPGLDSGNVGVAVRPTTPSRSKDIKRQTAGNAHVKHLKNTAFTVYHTKNDMKYYEVLDTACTAWSLVTCRVLWTATVDVETNDGVDTLTPGRE